MLNLSFSFRSALLSTKNDTWKMEVLSHLIPSDKSVWSMLLLRNLKTKGDDYKWTLDP